MLKQPVKYNGSFQCYPHTTKDDSSDNKWGTKLIYEMVVRDYYNSKENISGFCSMLEELPYLAKCGIEYIYLLGLMRHTGCPFEIIDPRDIDYRSGTFHDLQIFLDKAHSLGIEIISDWLANQHIAKVSFLVDQYPQRFLYTNVSDGNYFVEEGTRITKGRDLELGDLKRRIRIGNKIVKRLKDKELLTEEVMEIEGQAIHYCKANTAIRNLLGVSAGGSPPIIVTNDEALFVVSATDEISLRAYPRRWQTLAQPDLSSLEVRKEALDIGLFWLDKGLDGFRIDAATATFPDKIKENWGIEVDDNLSELFIKRTRKIKSKCFILFEGFERHDELLNLSQNRDSGVYSWKPRNFGTDALMYKNNLDYFINYLVQLEGNPMEQSYHLVNLGPEHDAFDFMDPWARLDVIDKRILYFIYMLIPGYTLVFNGQIAGMDYGYKNSYGLSEPAPKFSSANIVDKETGIFLFSLKKRYQLLRTGSYKFLPSEFKELLGICRYNDHEIIIGLINTSCHQLICRFDISSLINTHLLIRSGNVLLEERVFFFNTISPCVSTEIRTIRSNDLFQEGLTTKIKGKCFEIIYYSEKRSEPC